MRTLSPPAAVQLFAETLGWPTPALHQRTLPTQGELPELAIEWYDVVCARGVALQINRLPTWCACVFAFRFRICTGWRQFTLSTQSSRMKTEAERLRPLLGHDVFVTASSRRAFRQRYPECSRYTWRRLQLVGPPYRV